MKLNCYSIELVSSIGTPMKADTLAGQLLCNYAEKYGQTKMEKLVEEIHNGKLPFTISDSFPEGQLPSPTLPPVSREELHDYFPLESKDLKARHQLLQGFKEYKKTSKFIAFEHWLALRSGLSAKNIMKHFIGSHTVEDSTQGWKEEIRSESHNIIDRHTGRVLEQGGLFTSDTTWLAQDNQKARLNIYVATSSTDWQKEIEDLLERMGKTGFGRDSSTGKGHFHLGTAKDVSNLLELPEADARMTISTCATTTPSEVQGWYRLQTKFGKTWNGFGENRPFKKPLLMFEPGAIFSKFPHESTGIIKNIHRSNSKIIQYAAALLIPVKLDS